MDADSVGFGACGCCRTSCPDAVWISVRPALPCCCCGMTWYCWGWCTTCGCTDDACSTRIGCAGTVLPPAGCGTTEIPEADIGTHWTCMVPADGVAACWTAFCETFVADPLLMTKGDAEFADCTITFRLLHQTQTQTHVYTLGHK